MSLPRLPGVETPGYSRRPLRGEDWTTRWFHERSISLYQAFLCLRMAQPTNSSTNDTGKIYGTNPSTNQRLVHNLQPDEECEDINPRCELENFKYPLARHLTPDKKSNQHAQQTQK